MRDKLLALVRSFAERVVAAPDHTWPRLSIESKNGLMLVVTDAYADPKTVQVYDKEDPVSGQRPLLEFNCPPEKAVDLFLAAEGWTD